ncbi:hypothetical protein LUZ60_002642 [Juncus effusus]|nr:hypothetical protein LUZ60_002642 [Juncus effusus]
MSHELFLSRTTLLLTLFNILFCSCFCRTMPALSSPQGILMEDKVRLGSMPPSCHNRCNNCNPCTAVQIPTIPGQGTQLVHVSTDESPFSMYANYKPLGWKCRCGNQLYNP